MWSGETYVDVDVYDEGVAERERYVVSVVVVRFEDMVQRGPVSGRGQRRVECEEKRAQS